MKRLIRFEDKYGMSDIVCMAHKLGLTDFDKLVKEEIGTVYSTLNPKIFIQCGLKFPPVLQLDNEILAYIKANNIDEIIFVYDMDSPNPNKENIRRDKGILRESVLKEKLDNLREILKNAGLNHVKVKFAPIVWAAETLVLGIMLGGYVPKTLEESEEIIEVTELVHAKNTAKLHKRIVEEIIKKEAGFDGKKRAKRVRDYIVQQDIVPCLSDLLEYFPNSINKQVMKWVVYDNVEELYNIKGAVEHQQMIEGYHSEHYPLEGVKLDVFGIEIDMNKKCW